MKDVYESFLNFLEQEDKEKAVEIVIEELKKAKNDMDIIEIYNGILARSLNEMTCSLADKKICIWKEHIKSSIIKTILECAYPYVIKIKNSLNRDAKCKIAIICPDGEYHEIGARMIADFCLLAGFETVYVGANTPKEEFIYAINYVKPDIFAMSVTSFFNLVSAKKTITAIKEKANYRLKIVVGGSAFDNNPSAYKDIGADMLINDYEGILALAKEDI